MAVTLTIDVAAVRHNILTLRNRLAAQGIGILAVTKAADAEPDVARAMLEGGAIGVADSRLPGIVRLARHGLGPRVLIRPPEWEDLGLAARVADWVLLSDLDTARGLAAHAAARTGGRPLGVYLVVDLGDRRDGVLPEDAVDHARRLADLHGLALAGVAVNFACLSGQQPELRLFQEADEVLAQIAPWCATEPALSLGGTYCLPHLIDAFAPRHLCSIRLGAGIYFGHYTLPETRPIPGLMRADPALAATVLECREKPGPPEGTLGVDSFGRTPETLLPREKTYHVLLAMGRRESDLRCLTHPFLKGSYVAGMSSDHTLLISPHALKAGDTVEFALDYEGLVRAVTCGHVTKHFTERDHSLARHAAAQSAAAPPRALGGSRSSGA